MIIRKVTKLYKGEFVDLIDRDRKQAIDNKESVEFHYDGKIMTMDYREIRLKVKAISPFLPDKLGAGNPDYRLYSYKWIPDAKE